MSGSPAQFSKPKGDLSRTGGIRIFSIFTLLLCSFVVNGCDTRTASVSDDPRAEDGVLRLQLNDIESQPAIELGGDWEFYWNRLLEPGDFRANAPEPTGMLRMPGFWNGQTVGGRTFPARGFT